MDRQVRLGAAESLRPIVFLMPNRVSDAVCQAIREERDPKRALAYSLVLHSAYSRIRTGEVARGDRGPPSPNAGMIQSRRGPAPRVARACGAVRTSNGPWTCFRGGLELIAPTSRARLMEILVFAWWRCAEHAKGRASVLSIYS